jgi:protein TonB
MKTLLFSAALAIGFHAFLFSLGANSVPKKILYQPNKGPLSVSIDYVKPSTSRAPLSAKPPELRRQPEPFRRKTEKKLTRAKPPIQKPAVTKKAQTPPKPKEKAQENADLAGLPSLDPARVIGDTGSGPQVKEANVPSGNTSEGSSSTALPPPVSVRQAIPIYRSNPPPEYPATARRRGYEGTVIVEVLVNRQGRVQDLRLFQSSGYAVLDRAATAAIKNWLFEPGKAGDEKIEMWVKVPLRFELK